MKLGGIGQVVAGEIQKRLQREVRCVVLGHLQRGGNPTSFDRALATQYGTHAVRLISEGRFGEMVCYWPPKIDSVPITQAIHQLSTVDPYCSAVQSARALGICFGDCASNSNPFAANPNPTMIENHYMNHAASSQNIASPTGHSRNGSETNVTSVIEEVAAMAN
jgi:hypothetical protein